MHVYLQCVSDYDHYTYYVATYRPIYRAIFEFQRWKVPP